MGLDILQRWRARLAVRRALLAAARTRYKANPTLASFAVVERREEQVAFAERVVARHSGAPVVRRPFPLRTIGYGLLGPIRVVTVHHDAATITPTPAVSFVRARLRGYDEQHASEWGGGIGYHEAIDPEGRLWQMRAPFGKGAHVAKRNTGNYGIMLLGNFDIQDATQRQKDALRARLQEAPPPGLPDLRNVKMCGHRDWMPTACPGKDVYAFITGLRNYDGKVA